MTRHDVLNEQTPDQHAPTTGDAGDKNMQHHLPTLDTLVVEDMDKQPSSLGRRPSGRCLVRRTRTDGKDRNGRPDQANWERFRKIRWYAAATN